MAMCNAREECIILRLFLSHIFALMPHAVSNDSELTLSRFGFNSFLAACFILRQLHISDGNIIFLFIYSTKQSPS
jgi:hypothetical protein